MKNKYNIVAVNGNFDILHIGHVRLLRYAANYGDRLFVGINSDESIQQSKGKNYPINNHCIRREFLLSFDFVDNVTVFNELNAVNFLKSIHPHIYVCGGNYNLQTMNQEEKKYLESIGAEIKFFPFVESFSNNRKIIYDQE